MLLFVFLVAGTGKDFGLMHQYEVAARSGNDPSLEKASKGSTNDDDTKRLEPKDPSKARAYNAFIPILTFIFSTIIFGGEVIGQIFKVGSDSILNDWCRC